MIVDCDETRMTDEDLKLKNSQSESFFSNSNTERRERRERNI